MNKFLIILITLFVCGCRDYAHESNFSRDILPEGLKDCKFYEVNIDSQLLRIVRCPNSSTSNNYNYGKTNNNYNYGKTKQSIITNEL